MARKRKSDGPEGAVGIADPPPADAQPAERPAPPVKEGGSGPSEQPASPPVAEPTAPKTRSAASFAARSDRTTRLEVAVWARQVTVGGGEAYTQYSLSLSRGWKDTDGVWRDAGSYRAHDVPVLLYLVQQAYNWCLAQRTTARLEPEAEAPS